MTNTFDDIAQDNKRKKRTCGFTKTFGCGLKNRATNAKGKQYNINTQSQSPIKLFVFFFSLK